MSRKDHEKLGLATYEPAYITYYHGEHPEYKSPITTIVYWDCAGAAMLISEVHQSSSAFASWCGVGWAYPDYWCRSMQGHRGADGSSEDARSLEMMAAGCCPPELMTEFLQQEDSEKDAVVEAMKLHKRGYFGGGG